eukprot:jgi/Chrzof1/13041/Cz07g17200.t1
MYVQDWESFYQQAEELYRRRPLETRYCIKYRHQEGQLVLKVTDDVVCLKYKTDQQVDIKRMERLNAMFFALMARGSYTAGKSCCIVRTNSISTLSQMIMSNPQSKRQPQLSEKLIKADDEGDESASHPSVSMPASSAPTAPQHHPTLAGSTPCNTHSNSRSMQAAHGWAGYRAILEIGGCLGMSAYQQPASQ